MTVLLVLAAMVAALGAGACFRSRDWGTGALLAVIALVLVWLLVGDWPDPRT